ncbi:hypothetical protein KBA41_18820, partial [Candidatus Ozemobacteraceae bacterium]|nr:hypothetical protein [Candidatus Ozemobacteraceae bacterium]
QKRTTRDNFTTKTQKSKYYISVEGGSRSARATELGYQDILVAAGQRHSNPESDTPQRHQCTKDGVNVQK